MDLQVWLNDAALPMALLSRTVAGTPTWTAASQGNFESPKRLQEPLFCSEYHCFCKRHRYAGHDADIDFKFYDDQLYKINVFFVEDVELGAAYESKYGTPSSKDYNGKSWLNGRYFIHLDHDKATFLDTKLQDLVEKAHAENTSKTL